MMSGRDMVIADLVRKLEKSTVGTFPAIWEVFCKVVGENNPKNFENYIDRYKNK